MENFKLLPKMDDLLCDSDIERFLSELPRNVIVRELRRETENARASMKNGALREMARDELLTLIVGRAAKSLDEIKRDRLKRVINATGVVIHTNLGRAPLSGDIGDYVSAVASGYCNLEYSIVDGVRRSRIHYVEDLLKDITGAEAALVVNNNAAAVYLALRALCRDKEIIVSRGELVEIGDSFRVSSIIEESGCIVREVGTTNKTKLSDYMDNISERTALLLKVHTSNFKIVGFTEAVPAVELVAAKPKGVIVMEDMGSGVLTDLGAIGIRGERTVQQAVADGVDIVTFSGDKLLCGPQAGIIVGKKAYIDAMKKNQMTRCLRMDKMCLIALAETLRRYAMGRLEGLPVFDMMTKSPETLHEEAAALCDMLTRIDGVKARIGKHDATVGGGTMPGETLTSFAVYATVAGISPNECDKRLRNGEIPIITTIQNDELVINMRTVALGDLGVITDAFKSLTARR